MLASVVSVGGGSGSLLIPVSLSSLSVLAHRWRRLSRALAVRTLDRPAGASARLVFQDAPKPGCQALVRTGVLLLHFGQIGNCLFNSSYRWPQFYLLDIAPQTLEIPDRLHIGCSGRPFRDQFIDHIEDTAELLSITVRRNNLSLCFRRARIRLGYINGVSEKPARENRLAECLWSKGDRRASGDRRIGPCAYHVPRPGPLRRPFCGLRSLVHKASMRVRNENVHLRPGRGCGGLAPEAASATGRIGSGRPLRAYQRAGRAGMR